MTSSDVITSTEKSWKSLFAWWWNKLTKPHAEKEDDAQREYMIKVILVFNNLVTLPFILIAIPGWLLQLIPLDTVIILAMMGALFITGWIMADRGHWQLGGIIPCLILFAAGVYGNYVGGIDAPAMLLYALAIVLSAIVLDLRAQIIILLLSLISFFGLGLAHTNGYLPDVRDAGNMFINRVSIVFAALAAISLGVWFIKDQYQRSLTRARAYAENTRAIFETVTDGIIFTDLSGRILDLNEALLRLYHLKDKKQVLGEPASTFIAAEDRPRVNQFYRQMLSGSPGSSLHCKGEPLEGDIIFLDVNAALFLNSQGQPAGYVSSIRDITERKRAEEELARYREHLEEVVTERTVELKEAYNELESFSYSVSHDLRSPLRRIEGFSNILSESFASQLPEEGIEYLQQINESAQRMSNLISALLAFSRLIRQPVACSLIQPDKMARSVADELISGEYAGQNPDIIIQNMPTCNADPALLRQVYFNLLDNACKYSRKQEKTRIEVSFQKGERGETVYYVRDNGVGFDMQYANRLFGVFQRLHPNSEYPGTGIGLAMVQRIIRRHNGTIWAESAINQGTSFYFTLGNAQP
jgi:PAS domain S-box-containing protein